MTDAHDHAIDAALGWIEANLIQFALPTGPTTETTLKAIKPLGELVLVIDKIAERHSKFEALLKWSWKEFRGGELMLDILIARHDLIVLTTIYASFVNRGFSNPRLDQWIAYLRATAAHEGIEFPRWRRLDVDHALAKLDGERLSADSLRDTWIALRPEPWLMSDDTAYAVTHTLFYITDFGQAGHLLPDDIRDYLYLWLPAWLEISRRQRNFDLFAEWLMVAAYAGFDDIFAKHAAVLVAHQRSDGVFPGPSGSAEALLHDEMPAIRSDFLRNYHTTLVAILALAGLRQPPFD